MAVPVYHSPSDHYPESWYAQTLGQSALRSPLTENRESRVCVIGGGLAGLSVAQELTSRGLSVSVLEAGRVGWGASGRNGGFVTSGFARDFSEIARDIGVNQAERLHQHSQVGLNRVRENIQQFATDAWMGQGKLSVSRYPAAQEMQKSAELLQRLGESATYLDSEQLEQYVVSARYFDGVYKADGFQIHPLKYVCALADQIESVGGRVFEGSRAVSLESAGESATNPEWIVKTQNGEVRSAYVVICTSGYDAGFFSPISKSVLPVATHVVLTDPVTEILEGKLSPEVCVADTGNACDYYRMVDDGRLLWGGKITTMNRPPKALHQLMHRAISQVFPDLGDTGIAMGWSGLMGYCRHKMPVVKMVQPGLWISTAFGGHGLNTTAMAGELVATAIVQDDQRYKDFALYDLAWHGGWAGRAAVQAAYWQMQLVDNFAELRAKKQMR